MQPPASATSRRGFGWIRLAILAISLALVAFLLTRSADTMATLRSLDTRLLILITGLQTIYLLPQSYRYWIVLDAASDRTLSFWEWSRVFVVGRFLNLIISQAGNVYRAVYLKRYHSITYGEYVTAFFAFVWLGTVLNLLLAMAVVLLAPDPGTIGRWELTGALAGAVVVITLAPIVLSQLVRGAQEATSLWARLHNRAAALLHSAVGMLQDPRLIARFVGAGLVGFVIAVTIFALTFQALSIDVALADTVLFYVLLQLTTYIVITPGNFGIQELSFGGLAEATGIGVAPGLLAGAVVRVTGVLALLGTGLALGGLQALREARSGSTDNVQPNDAGTGSG